MDQRSELPVVKISSLAVKYMNEHIEHLDYDSLLVHFPAGKEGNHQIASDEELRKL